MSTTEDIDPDFWKKLEQCRDQNSMIEFYNSHAHAYEPAVKPTKYQAVHHHCASMLASLVPPADDVRILDVGCGTGMTGLVLREHGYSVIDGVDPSKGMLDICRQKPGLYRHLYCESINDNTDLTLDADSYDAAYCMHAISRSHIDIKNALREFCRLVRNNGYAGFSIQETTPPEEFLPVLARFVEQKKIKLLLLERRVSCTIDEVESYTFCCLVKITK